ncbi:MAG: hypothetical protein WC436_02855 [Candidatus Babeliales bacterium]
MIKKLLFILFFLLIINSAYTAEQNTTIASNPNANVTIINNPQPTNTTENKDSKSTETKEKSKNKDNIYLNFENASLASVVNYLAELKKINIIPNTEADFNNKKVTLTTRKNLSMEKAWDILLTLLEMNSYTIINVDNLYRIVAKNTNQKNPLPFYSSGSGTEPEDLPDSDMVVRYVYFLKNIQTSTIMPILNSMLDTPAQENTELQAFIITDKCLNIKTAMKVIKELDLGGLRDTIKIIKLTYANAMDVYNLFKPILTEQEKPGVIRFTAAQAGKPSSYFSYSTFMSTNTKENSLIFLGTEKGINTIVDFINKYIDVPLTAAQSRLHIKELKYAKADSKLVTTLKNLIKPPTGTQAGIQTEIQKFGAYKFFEDVQIVADATSSGYDSDSRRMSGGGNRLIISCNQDDWSRLSKFIDKLDKPQPQIAFEVMAVDVIIDKNNELDSYFKPKKQGLLGKGTNIRFMNDSVLKAAVNGVDGSLNPLVIFPGNLTTVTLGKKGLSGSENQNLWAIIQATLNSHNINIITQPFLVTNNGQPCEFSDIQTRQTIGNLDKSVGVQPIQNLIHAEATIKVELQPIINLDGTIGLIIKTKVQAFQSGSDTSNTATNDRQIETYLNIGEGEVLVLGGLTRTNQTDADYKTPVLGDIPIIGNLFKSKRKTIQKSNLYIFIRPTIIRPMLEGGVDEYTSLKLDYAKFQIINADTYITEKDPIQRWFFKPEGQTVKQTLDDAELGIYRPLDEFAYGARQPKSVDIKFDEYYRAKESVEEEVKKGYPKIHNDKNKEEYFNEKEILAQAEIPEKNVIINQRTRKKLKSRLKDR